MAATALRTANDGPSASNLPFARSLTTQDGRFDDVEFTRRHAWFIHTRLKWGDTARVAAQARMSQTAVRRYAKFDGDQNSQDWGPRKLQETYRLIHALGYSPAKVGFCLSMAGDRACFEHLLSGTFFLENTFTLDGKQSSSPSLRLG